MAPRLTRRVLLRPPLVSVLCRPLADFYVDDRAVPSASQLHKEIGHYPNSGYTATPPAPKPAAAVAPAEPPAQSRSWTSIGLALLVGGVCGAAISTLRPR